MAWFRRAGLGGRGKAGRTSASAIWLERLLLVAGSAGLLYCFASGALMLASARAAKHYAAEDGVKVSPADGEQAKSRESALYAAGAVTNGAHPAVVGRVEIPAIGLVTPLLAGDDSMSLTEGAGHIPGTALPGGLGTVGIAGHRDTHFRSLAKAAPGMEVRLVTREGVYRYRVTSSEIVTPDQVSVLEIGQVPSLALVTCYPFRFIGHAPKRFILHAELVSLMPDGRENGLGSDPTGR